MQTALICWKCGASLKDVPMPLSRLSMCLACGADLYVCLLCKFHDPKLHSGCREDRAEHVKDKDRANFCEFFVPRPGAFTARDTSKSDDARARLDALFGGTGEPGTSRNPLDDLFGGNTKK